MEFDYLIVGSGLTGAIFAERLSSKGSRVLIIDKREHIAGSAYDYYAGDVLVHKYGPHIFHTNNKKVWDYLSRFTEWFPYIHKVRAHIEGALVPLPFNLNSVAMCFSAERALKIEAALLREFEGKTRVSVTELKNSASSDIAFLAEYVWEKVFKNYTAKQWGIRIEEIDLNVLARVPVALSRDDAYFTDTYQGIPARGYTAMVERLLSHPNIKLMTNVSFCELDKGVKYRNLIYTGPVDEFYRYKYGKLPYRSMRFETKILPLEEFQPFAVVNYPNDYDFVRITEHKHFLRRHTKNTVITEEYPEMYNAGKNDPYYPIQNRENQTLYEKYLKRRKNVIFAGRLGSYRYLNMDEAAALALDGSERIC